MGRVLNGVVSLPDMSTDNLTEGTTNLYWLDNGVSQGRLTLTSGTPVTTADVTAAATLYFTPYCGNRIALYTGSAWKMYNFTEKSLALTLTSGKNYDVFIYDNAGTLTLELSQAWTNDTTRADALALQDGVLVKSGATTRKWLGTIRASDTNKTEDSVTKRFVLNAYNREMRRLYKLDTTNHTYTTATYRQWNSDANNKVEFLCGTDTLVYLFAKFSISSDTANVALRGSIGLDITNNTSADVPDSIDSQAANCMINAHSIYRNFPGLGYHYLSLVQYSAASGTTTWNRFYASGYVLS